MLIQTHRPTFDLVTVRALKPSEPLIDHADSCRDPRPRGPSVLACDAFMAGYHEGLGTLLLSANQLKGRWLN